MITISESTVVCFLCREGRDEIWLLVHLNYKSWVKISARLKWKSMYKYVKIEKAQKRDWNDNSATRLNFHTTNLHKYSYFVFWFYTLAIHMKGQYVQVVSLIYLLKYRNHPNLVSVLFQFWYSYMLFHFLNVFFNIL